MADVLSIAENANTHQPLGPRDERIERDDFVLWMGAGKEPGWNVVQRLRLADDAVDRTIEEVHELLRARGRDACTWEIGSSATPPDLVARLKARGLVDDADPHVIAMVLDREPPEVPGVEARPARDADERRAARAIAWQAFGMPGEPPDDEPVEWSRTFVALVGGEIVGAGTSTYVEGAVTLNGGAVRDAARGRGAYRALVRARWEDAVARGTPVLVTQAGRMSAPILERLGFREVARIHILLDELRDAGAAP